VVLIEVWVDGFQKGSDEGDLEGGPDNGSFVPDVHDCRWSAMFAPAQTRREPLTLIISYQAQNQRQGKRPPIEAVENSGEEACGI
jgi:hypothetical protein